MPCYDIIIAFSIKVRIGFLFLIKTMNHPKNLLLSSKRKLMMIKANTMKHYYKQTPFLYSLNLPYQTSYGNLISHYMFHHLLRQSFIFNAVDSLAIIVHWIL